MLDLTWKHFGYSQLWPACSQNQAESYKPDPISCIWFGSILHTVQNRPRSSLDGLSGFGQMHLAQKQESSDLVSGRMQPARYQFPTFRFSCILPQTARIMLYKTRPDLIWFWLTVSGFGQTGPVKKQAGVHKLSGPLLANASKPIRIRCESDPAWLLSYLPIMLYTIIHILPRVLPPAKPQKVAILFTRIRTKNLNCILPVKKRIVLDFSPCIIYCLEAWKWKAKMSWIKWWMCVATLWVKDKSTEVSCINIVWYGRLGWLWMTTAMSLLNIMSFFHLVDDFTYRNQIQLIAFLNR